MNRGSRELTYTKQVLRTFRDLLYELENNYTYFLDNKIISEFVVDEATVDQININQRVSEFLTYCAHYVLPLPSQDDNDCMKRLRKNRNIFMLFKYFSEYLPMSTISEAFNTTEKLMHKTISCYGGEISTIQFQALTKIPYSVKVFLGIVLTVACILSVFGNAWLINWLLPYKKRFCLKRNHPTNSIVQTSLAITKKQTVKKSCEINNKTSDIHYLVPSIFDLFFTLTILPSFIITILKDGIWKFSAPLCKIHAYIGNLVLCITSFTIVTCSIERYVSIIKPKQVKCGSSNGLLRRFFCSRKSCYSKRGIFILLAIYWAIALVITIPYYLYTRNLSVITGAGCLSITDDYMCLNVWHTNNRIIENIYETAYWSVIFIIPGLILLFTYGSIAWHLFVRNPVGLGNDRTNYKRRIIKVLMLDCFFYCLCWFPYSVWSIKVSFDGFSNNYKPNIRNHVTMYTLLYSLALINITLKWIFRVFGTLPRVRQKLRCYKDALQRKNPRVLPIQQQNEREKQEKMPKISIIEATNIQKPFLVSVKPTLDSNGLTRIMDNKTASHLNVSNNNKNMSKIRSGYTISNNMNISTASTVDCYDIIQ